MENKRTIQSDGERSKQANDNAGLAISRRQFSLGISGLLLAGTLLEQSEHSTSSALTTKNSLLPYQQIPQKLTHTVFNQPQYILSNTLASLWSPNSQYIATFQENTVTLHDAKFGKHKLVYRNHKDEVLTVKWSPDSNYLASSGFDHIVHVWNANAGQTITLYKGHTDIVRDVAWSPNQQYLASAGYDKTIQVWEALTGVPVVTYSGHEAEIQTLTWSPDNRLIASTDLQNKTMIWRFV